LGAGKEAFFSGLLSGKVGIDRIKAFDPSAFSSQVGGEAPIMSMNQVVPKAHRKATKLMARDIELAVIAADGAVRDAGLSTKGSCPEGGQVNIDPTRSGVNVGAGLICCDLVELGSAAEKAVEGGKFSYAKWGREGMEALTPLWLLKYLPNMLSCHISIIHDLQGPSNSITCADASGLLAVGEAYRTIARGRAEVMIAGGAESKINAMGLLRQCLLGLASTHYNDRPTEACRPFDRDADGLVVGEGAGIVVLEELEHARRRGARIYGELRGFSASNTFCTNIVEPEADGEGISIALAQAAKEAGADWNEVGFLVAHGLAAPANDRAEAAGIGRVLGARAKTMPIVATKSRIGNCGAGAGAIDLVTAALALEAGRIPGNVNCPNARAEYGLNLAGAEGMERNKNFAAVCCHTFGGQTAAMLIGRTVE